MKSELTFLTDLFLNDEVPSPIKKIIAGRIKEVEKELTQAPAILAPPSLWNREVGTPMPSGPNAISQQAPSMLKIMEKNPDLIPRPPVAKTPAAAAALLERQKLISGASKEKPEEGRNSPRKI